MKKRIGVSMAAALLMLARAITASAQPGPQTNLWGVLPESDIIAYVNVERLIGEALPRIASGDASLTKNLAKQMDDFKAHTGIDMRQVSRIVVAVRTAGMSTAGMSYDAQDFLILAQGSFETGTVINAIRRDPQNGPATEERHGAHMLVLFRSPAEAAGPSAGPAKAATGPAGSGAHKPFAVAPLAPGVIAAGNVEAVRRALDAFDSGQTPVNGDLISSVRNAPDALLGLSARVPPDIQKQAAAKPSNRLLHLLASVKQVRARLDLGPAGYPLVFGLTSDTPQSAGDLRCMIDSVRVLAAGGIELFLPTIMPVDPTQKDKAASSFPVSETVSVLNGLNISVEGNEVLVQTEISQQMLRSMWSGMSSTSTEATPKPASAP